MIFERGHFSKTVIKESILTESLKEVRNFSATKETTSQTTVFLSHKHKDIEDLVEVRGVIGVLQGLGVKVYIDSMDNKMPEQTSGETALRIKEVIKFCNKFILLATNKAIESYWCNWELGIGDVHKFIQKNIAILPVKEKGTYDSSYKGNEYLQIYQSIQYRDGTTKYNDGRTIPQGYYVESPEDKNGNISLIPLSTWLKSV